MKNSQAGMSSQALWYVLWSAILLVAAGNTVFYSQVLAGARGLAFSGLLVAIACIQLLRGSEFLSRRETALSVVLLVVFFLAQVVQFARGLGPPSSNRGVDFKAYYLAGKTMVDTPAQSIYELPRLADGRLNLNADKPPFIYPPFFAVLMAPLAHLSFASAYLAWTIVTIISVIGAVLLTVNLSGVRMTGRLALMLGVGLFSYYPFFDHLFYGQVTGVILFLFAAALWLLVRKRPLGSALCIAVATMMKLTPVLVVPVLLIHRRWRWLGAYSLWMAALLGFAVWQAGWAAHAEFLHKALPSMSCGDPVCQNTSVVAWVQEIFLGRVPVSAHPAETIPAGACAVSRWVALGIYLLMLGRCWMRRPRTQDDDGQLVRDIVVIAMLGIAVSPISWWHHSVLDLLPFLYLWGTGPAKGERALTAGDWLLTVLALIVSTNVVGFIALGLVNHVAQLIFAAIVPGLTIAVAWMMLGRSAGAVAENIEADGQVAFSN